MAKTKVAKIHSKLEVSFDATFATKLAIREKQIQQSYRPIIGIHKWFARRPGTIFRSLILSEFSDQPLENSFWKTHQFRGVIADPFMGGGTPIFEANRLGFSVVGTDINPMAHWLVHQSLAPLDIGLFQSTAKEVAEDVETTIGKLYKTKCLKCSADADVKYFLWVKTAPCPSCKTTNDLFPGFLLAEAERHPANVIACSSCGCLNECLRLPSNESPMDCTRCSKPLRVEGRAKRGTVSCHKCSFVYPYMTKSPTKPLQHRLWALEYHCKSCKPTHEGRFFKEPAKSDINSSIKAGRMLSEQSNLLIPEEPIPEGDETTRLHRWGYRFYREMFNDRQLLGLSLLLRRIMEVSQPSCRHALLTVFSDFLRYQNLLCRYDTYALKCQDIFSVHGFPVGLVQCENNLLGIAGVGSGSFRHFVEKYVRAKKYCLEPFETLQEGNRKTLIPIKGERILAQFVNRFPTSGHDIPQANLKAAPAWEMPLPKASLDAVFTDPPYFDNVQYAELMDFCFAWLRIGLKSEFHEFERTTTRTPNELTGNETLGRGIEHFTSGMSTVFRHYAAALKPNAPFVFTYHHNSATAYLPLVVAILDAGLNCTATLPAAAEMNASLHIAGTGSSVLDSVFVCRRPAQPLQLNRQDSLPLTITHDLESALKQDSAAMCAAGLKISKGDLRCLSAGHIARLTINYLAPDWDSDLELAHRLQIAADRLKYFSDHIRFDTLAENILNDILASTMKHDAAPV